MSTTTDLTELVINYLTEAQYEAAVSGGTIDPDQLYLTPETNIPVTDVEVDGSSVVSGGVAEIDLTGKSDVGHTHTKSQITDFPTIPTITDTYSGTSSNGMSGKAVKQAIDALDGTVSGSAGSGKTLTALSQTNGVVSATFGNISITKSQVSDFPSLATVATSGSYNDLSNKPTIPTVPTTVSSFTNDAGYITGYTETDPVFTASDAYGISSTDISNWDNAFDGNIDFDTTAVSGDDYNLKTILTTLGWLNDVIV